MCGGQNRRAWVAGVSQRGVAGHGMCECGGVIIMHGRIQ